MHVYDVELIHDWSAKKQHAHLTFKRLQNPTFNFVIFSELLYANRYSDGLLN